MTLKKQVFDNPDKMHFDSPLKAFNQQTVLIAPGQVVAPTQYSHHIRASTDTNCWNSECAPGYLQAFDLETFVDYYHIPSYIIRSVKQLTHDEPGILYLFKHTTSTGTIINDGLVLTDTQSNHIKTWYTNSDWRAQEAVTEARSYIAHAESLPGYQRLQEQEEEQHYA